MDIDRFSAEEIVRLMNEEDSKIAAAVAREIPAIARAVDAIVIGMRNGGRLFYVGAGSSGRLGVLDAAECAPTFGTSRKQVQALIAGGKRAVTSAVEGAEDSTRNGERDLSAKRLTQNDVVVGVAASGSTPYVLGALKHARRRKATTVAVTANRNMPVARLAKILIAPEVGPEVLTGSTRLKAGTAQKMVLNMLSTAAMVRLGHAYENLMIDLLSTNEKLSDRSLRILVEASGKSVPATRHALRKSGRNLRVALVMLKLNVDVAKAKQLLKSAGGNLRRALGDDIHEPRYIATVPTLGYRFLPEVQVAEDGHLSLGIPVQNGHVTESGTTETERPPTGERPPRPRAQSPQRWAAALVIIGAVVIVGIIVVVTVGRFRSSAPQKASSDSVHSLAVLPFENLSGDAEQEYFADGMTAELITELAKISSIRVISRTSVMRYKRIRKPLGDIARELSVDAVVEGEVLRSQNRVRVTAQLVDASTDRHLWSETYDRDLHDVVSLQADVAQSIAKAVGARVTPAEGSHHALTRPMDPEAYEAYLRGRLFLEKRTTVGFNKAVDYFQQAVRIDPRFAESYAGLAKTYDVLGTYGILPPQDGVRTRRILEAPWPACRAEAAKRAPPRSASTREDRPASPCTATSRCYRCSRCANRRPSCHSGRAGSFPRGTR